VPEHPEPLLSRGSWPEARRLTALLRRETVGGVLLIAAATIALVWANSPAADSYFALRDTTIGPSALHLDLTLGEWAADGLLAIFFFVAGLELKREFVVGDLRDPRRAALPIAAALGGMLVPAVIFVAISWAGPPEALRGWAIPTATDIAFSLAVLAVVSSHLPTALRTFLLTLAIVDDLLAIIVIACFYTETFSPGLLLLTLVPLGLFTVLVQRRVTAWWLLLPLALIAWALMHASGVHATVAGVLLGFAVPVKPRRPAALGGEPGAAIDHGADRDLAERFEHIWRPVSAGVAVPVFAFFAAGVDVGGWSQFVDSLTDRLTVAVVVALVVGKTIGVWLAARLVAAFTKATLAPQLSWWDVFGVALLAGMGFTVSLLIGELAFGTGTPEDDAVKIGVIVGSVVAALLAAVVLRVRNTVYRRLAEEEAVDSDLDGTPDVYQQEPPRD
jgi:Na+:H+ antiporter, NhaA family